MTHPRRATSVLLAIVTATVAACDLGMKSVGDEGRDSDDAAETGTGEGEGEGGEGGGSASGSGGSASSTHGGSGSTTGEPPCMAGDTRPADDGCNECKCDEHGQWVCTLIGCHETDSATGGHPATCGDGILDAGEECDDGNAVEGDGCSKICTLEHCADPTDPNCYDPCAGKVCGDDCHLCPPDDPDCAETGEVKVCDPEGHCVSDTGKVCDPAGTGTDGHTGVCGDGIVDPGEECDDGNAVEHDGCSTTCMLEHCPDPGDPNC